MNLLSRLFGRKPDDREQVRPLWHRVVEMAREREWYADCGVAGTVPGRFDMVTLVMAAVLLRMENWFCNSCKRCPKCNTLGNLYAVADAPGCYKRGHDARALCKCPRSGDANVPEVIDRRRIVVTQDLHARPRCATGSGNIDGCYANIG